MHYEFCSPDNRSDLASDPASESVYFLMKRIEKPVTLFGGSPADQGGFLHQVTEGIFNPVSYTHLTLPTKRIV